MSSIQAVIVDPSTPGRLKLAAVPAPSPASTEALVRLKAISLNRGEVRRAGSAEAGWRPGWDLAGTVEQPAADGSGPGQGARVVGMLDSGAWAEVVAVPTNRLAELPEPVSFAQAATLPVAGLTALRSLARGGLLLARNVLITGASGGVGHFACQIARHGGAHVTGIVGQPDHESVATEAGAQVVVSSEDLPSARAHGPYHLVLESVGGEQFGQIMTMLAPGGTCVLFGTTAGADLSFNGSSFYLTGGASLYGFILFYEIAHDPPVDDLTRLAGMVAAGTLRPRITVEASWTDIGRVAQDLTERRITGKAVLHVGG